MPAIQLARLKIQSANLAKSFADPQAFVGGLHELLDFYADRTRRPGQAGEPPPLLFAYNVPVQVLRQILRELSPYTADNNQAGLTLCDALWAEPYFEFRLLAASLLGEIKPSVPDAHLERVDKWTTSQTEDRLMNVLVKDGLNPLRHNYPDQYLKQVEIWLQSVEIHSQKLGLRALTTLIATQDFENLPALYRILAPQVRTAPAQLKPDLLDTIKALAQRFPNEAAFFLRQNLAIKTDNLGTAWLIRNSLRYFPEDTQISLKAALRQDQLLDSNQDSGT